ncbi:MAG TPA: S41 family peptidase [Verrucomicrobiae bacterium]|jgi:carboxyl-terminal processing protease|nr:S41 family peptidase [Verrucomicrobiae bacterium]
MKKRILYICLVTVLGLNLLIGAQIYVQNTQAAEGENVYEEIRLFMRVLERVRQDYVDGEKVTYQDLIRAAMKGMLSTLDPHSEYMEPVKYTELKNDTEGAFGGVGIVVGMRDSFLTVVSPMEDSPAYHAGILTGDKIVKIDGRSTEKISMPEAVKKLRGEPGTDVTITIMRQGSPLKDYKLTRSTIKVETVKDVNGNHQFPIGENKIGYVRITQFGEQTTAEFRDALEKLKKQGVEGLIMDLRNNPGGLLDQAVKVCDIFLPGGQLIVSTEGRSPRMKTEQYKATGRDEYPNVHMAILVNEGSASASEIVSGCLQDLHRAFIVGEQTFGKGSVQSIMPLEDGSALRLTTAKYYTPSHKVIHEHGITPDAIVPMTPEQEEARILKQVVGGFESLDDAQKDRIRNIHDAQLDRAQDYLKSIIVFRDRASSRKEVHQQIASQREAP